MFFKNKNKNLDNQRFDSTVKNSNKPIFWQISSSSYEKSIILTHLSITLIIFIVFVFKININIEKETIYSLIQIATSFGALSLAIPLFLKDFNIQKILWRSFLILSVLFIFSTILGIVVTVFFPSEKYNLQFTLIFIIAIIISINLRTSLSVLRLQNQRKKNDKFCIEVRPSSWYDFLGIAILIVVSLIFAHGIASSFIVLFFYSLLTLVTIIIATVISTLKIEQKDLKTELKCSIQELLEDNPKIAFTEQKIIDELRKKYKERSQQISKTSVLVAISEMDSEINNNLPVATIFSSNLVIPRWSDCFKQEAQKVIKNKFDYDYDLQKIKRIEDDEEEILSIISRESNLSVELLIDGNILPDAIKYLKKLRKKKLREQTLDIL